MLRSICIIQWLFLALILTPAPQNSDKYLTLKVSDTAGAKVDRIAITCKENCVSEGLRDGSIKLALPSHTTTAGSIILEIVRNSDHPDWMIVSPAGGRVSISSLAAKPDNTISVTVLRVGREDADNVHRLDELAGG